jgi:thiol:disulfide interchange protein DsbC
MEINMRIKHLLGACLFGLTTMAHGAPSEAETLLTTLKNERNIPALSVSSSAVTGLYEVVTERGVYYSDPSGRYLLAGELYDMKTGSNLTEVGMSSLRKQRLADFTQDMIVYPAKDEKFVVTVFTDTSCGYCRKLHSQLSSYQEKDPKTGDLETKPGYTDLGITVRYLAFPRGGIQSPAYKQMVSVWCSDDKNDALSKAKMGQSIEPKTCENNIIKQYQLGELFGVRGTPAIVMPDGSMVPGYQPPDAMLSHLKTLSAQ